MAALTRWNPFEEIFNVQREMDRLFNQFWNDLPARTASVWSPSFRVETNEDGWRLEVPMPGVDPEHVVLEAAGNTLSIRAEETDDKGRKTMQYEQTLTVPQFLDLEKISASHKHEMLLLNVPLKESVKPRRIQIQRAQEEQKQLVGA